MPNFGSHLSGPIRHTARFRDQSDRAWFRDLPIGMNDPDFVHQFVDFLKVDDYTTGNYTLSSSGTGGSVAAATSSSAVLTTAQTLGGNAWVGALLMQTGSTAGNYSNVQNKVLPWLLDTSISPNVHSLQSSKKMWFEAAWTVDTSASDVDAFIGLSETQVNAIGLSQNYVGFRVTNGGTNISLVSSTAGAVTTTTSFSGGSNNPVKMNSGQLVTCGFVFENSNSVSFYLNRNFVGQYRGGFPTSPLATTMQVITNSANNRNMLVDYFYVCRMR